jgi:methylated-DNA-[protein]-cysteine S-methyltransferase
VLRATRAIPRGAVRTYGEVARRVGRPRAARAVGQALHRNPVPLLVPCHRVIGAGGRLVGFGSGIGEKQRLLRLEGAWPRKKA